MQILWESFLTTISHFQDPSAQVILRVQFLHNLLRINEHSLLLSNKQWCSHLWQEEEEEPGCQWIVWRSWTDSANECKVIKEEKDLYQAFFYSFHFSSFDEEADSDLKLESGAEDPITSDRDGRFLLYWLTTTSTSTTTIYTGTSTLATLDCTPNGYTLNACG